MAAQINTGLQRKYYPKYVKYNKRMRVNMSVLQIGIGGLLYFALY